ncbi:MAG: hypothetical protein WCJ35_25780 [Planctomycetota bacterium]
MKNNLTIVVGFGLLLSIVVLGCGKPDASKVENNASKAQSPPAESAKPVATVATPVDRFKKLVEKWRGELSKQGKVDVSYDVRKTDSLVTPLLGIVEILWLEPESLIKDPHYRESYYPAKGEVSKPSVAPVCKQTVSYALQEDCWVLKDSKVEIANYDKLLIPGRLLTIGEEMTNAGVKWRMIALLKRVQAALSEGSPVHKVLESTAE